MNSIRAKKILWDLGHDEKRTKYLAVAVASTEFFFVSSRSVPTLTLASNFRLLFLDVVFSYFFYSLAAVLADCWLPMLLLLLLPAAALKIELKYNRIDFIYCRSTYTVIQL